MSLSPTPTSAGPGDLLWEQSARMPGGPAEVLSVSTSDGRVATVGFATLASGKAWWVRAHDSRTGALLWEDVREHGEAIDSNGGHGRFLVAGTVGPAGDRDILVVAYASATGAVLWSDRIDTGGDDVAGSLSMSADGGTVTVAGTADGALFVRTYAAETAAILWTNVVPGQHQVGAAWVDNLVFVCGSRGEDEAADFVLRVYNAKTGALRREHLTDTGGAEDRCLSAAGPGGEIWTAGFGTVNGQTDFLVRVYSTPRNTLALSDRVDLAGGEDKALALAYQRNRAGATGFGTSARGDRDILTRVYDLVRRELLWEDVRDPSGGGDDEGLAAVVAAERLFVVGRAAEHPVVLAFAFRRPKVLYWQAISAHRGAARAITAANGRIFVAGAIEGADGVLQLWVAAYDGF